MSTIFAAMNLVIAGPERRGALPVLLTFLKSAAVLAFLVYLQIKFPRIWSKSVLERLERFGKSLSARRGLCVFLVGLSQRVLQAAVMPAAGMPVLEGHEDYSFLLAANSFAHGGRTNPPHRVCILLETFLVIWRPAYVSMCPPGQGLVLAVGEILGNPWI